MDLQFTDMVVASYIVTTSSHGFITDELEFVETISVEFWDAFGKLIRIAEQLNIYEDVVTIAAHVTQNNPPSVDKLLFLENVTVELISNRFGIVVTDAISIVDSLLRSQVRPTSEGIGVNEAITFNKIMSRSFVETLTFVEFAIAYIPSIYWNPPNIPVPTMPGHLKLEDVDGQSGSIQIRTPEFGDTESYNPTRIGRESRGGDLIVFRDNMWPSADTFEFEFSYLSGADAAALISFLSDTLGRHITLTDQYNRSFVGYITTPESAILQPKVNGFGAKFAFQIKES